VDISGQGGLLEGLMAALNISLHFYWLCVSLSPSEYFHGGML
jgi:hypothetical protein